MNFRIVGLSIVLGVLASGCVGVSVNRNDAPTARRTSGSGEAAMQLLAVDVEFARLSTERGATEAFARYCDANSLRVTPSGPNLVGPAAFAAELQSLPAGALTWTPRNAEVSASGDLGWTWGDFVLREANGERRGRYVTVWRWNHGQWWIAADIGTVACP